MNRIKQEDEAIDMPRKSDVQTQGYMDNSFLYPQNIAFAGYAIYIDISFFSEIC